LSRRINTKGWARWSLYAVTLAAVTFTAILGGQRYFYCRAMDQIMSETCCGCTRDHVDRSDQTSVGSLNDCVEVRFLRRMVSFTVVADFSVPAAGLVGILPSPALEVGPFHVTRTGLEHSIRAGPRSPAASRSQLMVFLT
jgi:hypothetical protein